jgi:hypothetical protein
MTYYDCSSGSGFPQTMYVDALQYRNPRTVASEQTTSCAMMALGVLVLWMLLQRSNQPLQHYRPVAYASSMLAQVLPGDVRLGGMQDVATAVSARLASAVGGTTTVQPAESVYAGVTPGAAQCLRGPSDAGDARKHATEEALRQWIAAHPHGAVVIVYADWCGHCKTMRESLENDGIPKLLVEGDGLPQGALGRCGAAVDDPEHYPWVTATDHGSLVYEGNVPQALAKCAASLSDAIVAAGVATVEDAAAPGVDFLDTMFSSE